jgi:hypothetical protein
VLLEGWAWWTMKILRFFTNFHSSNLISWPWRGRCVFIVDNVWEITGKLWGFYPHPHLGFAPCWKTNELIGWGSVPDEAHEDLLEFQRANIPFK